MDLHTRQVTMGLFSNWGNKLAQLFGDTDVDYEKIDDQPSDSLDADYLSSLLSYRLYDPVTKIYENKNSFGFFFELIPLLGMNENSQKQISALINDIGEDGASIQCMIWADPRIDPFLDNWNKPREKIGGVYKKVADKKLDFFRKNSFQGESPPRVFRVLFSYSIPRPPESQIAVLLKGLSEKREKAVNALGQFNNVLDTSVLDFLNLMSGLLNFEQDTSVHMRKKWSQENYLSHQMCLPGGGVEVTPNALRLRGKDTTLFRAYEVIDFPDFWSMAMQQELIGDFMSNSHRIETPFYIHYGIHFPKQDQSETRLQAKMKYLDHQSKNPYIRRMAPKVQAELEENMFVSQQLQSGEKIISTRLSVGLWSPPEIISKAEATLEALFRKYNFKIQPMKFHHLNDLLFSLPMAWGENSKQMNQYKKHMGLRTTYTGEAANFLPLLGEWWGNSRDGMVFMGRRGQIAAWDPFESIGNYNIAVVGPSGQGKSVFMQDLVLTELGKGGRVFLIDLGRSFEKLCQLLDGQFLFFNQKSNLNLNPFQIASKLKGADGVEMVSSIIGTMAMPFSVLNKEKMDLICSAVKQVWVQKGAKGTVDDVISFIKKSAYQSELMRGAVESLCLGLEKYSTKGIYKNYFYGDQEVDFTSDFVVIETEELKDVEDLQAVIMQVFVLQISGHVFTGNRETRSYIVIDEAWDLLKSPQMHGFIGNLARRTRKYNSSLVVGTQGLKDFEQSKGAEAAFSNSDWLVIIGGDAEVVKGLQENDIIPNMSEALAEILRSMRKVRGKYGESFIYDKKRQQGSVNRLFLDPFSAMLYSTKAEEFSLVQRLSALGMTVEDSVEWLMDNKPKIEQMLSRGVKISEIVSKLYIPKENHYELSDGLQKIALSKQENVGSNL